MCQWICQLSRYNFTGLNDPHGQAYYWLKDSYHDLEINEGTDYHLLKEGYVTISPIELNHTQKRKIDTISRWFKQYATTEEEY
ncbi:hypothetical protein [Lentibacillus sp. CBA3610]|uniref:hypothetical protein n=1 Tax=Lentibacillus sp. CBA3610 TaxID=2518176 RepID=UPI0020D1FAEE|nr:hypothetical protein [Lentibacillus sp. CBA3610]